MNSNYKVIKFRSNNSKEVNDQISIEEPLEIILRYKDKKNWIENTISITMRTPGDDEDLVTGFLFNERVIEKINHIEKDYLKILKLFLKTKYVWGGKTYRGIDCSAILQLFFYYNSKFYPRDTKDQIKYSIKKNKGGVFKKGDIIFWKGHVAVCINSQKLIHAYGPEKKVLIMNITETINRIERTAKLIVKKISSIKY